MYFQHGRVKVRTSEEEKARKEKERQEKLKVFKHAMQKILHKVSGLSNGITMTSSNE